MQQLALALAPPPEPTFDSFFAARNAAPFEMLRQAANRGANSGQGALGDERFIYLWGERGSGKSHLLRAFVAEVISHGSDARYCRAGENMGAGEGATQAAVDDVDGLDMVGQLALFDLYNRIRTCGGGYGPPEEREPERVLCDVLQGKISIERARDIYRVAVRDRRLDAAVTAELRRTV